MGITKTATRTALDVLPGASQEDIYATALEGAADKIDGVASDAYSAPIVESLRGSLLAIQKARRLAWLANDALISQFSGAYSLVSQQQQQARDAVPQNGFGMGADREIAVQAAGDRQWTESKAALARGVVAQFSTEADAVGQAVGDTLNEAQRALDLAGLVWTGPYSMRPDTTDAMATKADSLEREIGRTGLVMATQIFSAMVDRKPDADLYLYSEACLRSIDAVKQTADPDLHVRFPNRGEAGEQREASFTLRNMIDAWMAAHRPKSITVGREVLVSLLAVANDLTGIGNAGGMSSGAFDSAYLYPSSVAAGAKAINSYQTASGWLARFLPPVGSVPKGYSPIAGKTTNGLPYRFALGAS